MIDLKGYERIAQSLNDYESPIETSGNVLINDLLINMAGHVHSQLEESFNAVLEYDEYKAKKLWRWIMPQTTWLRELGPQLKQ